MVSKIIIIVFLFFLKRFYNVLFLSKENKLKIIKYFDVTFSFCIKITYISFYHHHNAPHPFFSITSYSSS